MEAYVHGESGPLADQVVGRFRRYAARMDYVFLALGRLIDVRQELDLDVVRTLLDYTNERQLRPLAVQARRAIGVFDRNVAELQGSLEDFRAMGARPFVARVTAELGELRDDDSIDLAFIHESQQPLHARPLERLR